MIKLSAYSERDSFLRNSSCAKAEVPSEMESPLLLTGFSISSAPMPPYSL